MESRAQTPQVAEPDYERISRRNFLGHSLVFAGFGLMGIGALDKFNTPGPSPEEVDVRLEVMAAGGILMAAGSTLIALSESEKNDETSRRNLVIHTALAGGALLTVAVYKRLWEYVKDNRAGMDERSALRGF